MKSLSVRGSDEDKSTTAGPIIVKSPDADSQTSINNYYLLVIIYLISLHFFPRGWLAASYGLIALLQAWNTILPIIS